MDLGTFNALSNADARAALLLCCASARWADSLAGARPFTSVDGLVDAARVAVAGLDQPELDAALAGHPRIGERAEGPDGAWSRQEQAGASLADELTRADLVTGNQAYEERFGHVYLVCATGRSADELLALLRARLDHDLVTERRVVRGELHAINTIRLHRLLDDPPSEGAP